MDADSRVSHCVTRQAVKYEHCPVFLQHGDSNTVHRNHVPVEVQRCTVRVNNYFCTRTEWGYLELTAVWRASQEKLVQKLLNGYELFLLLDRLAFLVLINESVCCSQYIMFSDRTTLNYEF